MTARHATGIRSMRLEFMPGVSTFEAAKRCVELMHVCECEIVANFGGIDIKIYSNDSPEDVIARYFELRNPCPKS